MNNQPARGDAFFYVVMALALIAALVRAAINHFKG
jgi:hypothetical protein